MPSNTEVDPCVKTNIGFEAFGNYLGDQVVTTSIVDRTIHHAIIISVNGPSYRIHYSPPRDDQHLPQVISYLNISRRCV
jgi:DNA replication protein DnaC